MVSGGGGAEQVSADAALDAVRAGRAITVSDRTSRLGHIFDPPQPRDLIAPGDSIPYHHMVYRQAGLFVAFLRDRDPERFAGLMDRILDGRLFAEAVRDGLGLTVAEAWKEFAASARAGRPDP